MNRENENKYIFVLLLGTAFMCTAGIWVKLSSIPPINFGFYRMVMTLLMFVPFTWKSLKGITKKQFLLAFIAGIGLGGDVLFWNLSLMKTSVANSALLVNLTVFIVSPISFFIFKEKIKKEFWLGAVIGFIGVVVVIFASATSKGEATIYGNILAIFASVSYSIYILFVYKVRDELNNNAVIAITTLAAMIFLIVVMIPVEGFYVTTSPKEISILIAYSICIQILGQGLTSMCLGKLNATLVTVISLVGIGISSVYAFIVFGESLMPMEIIGMLITIVGVFMAKQASQE